MQSILAITKRPAFIFALITIILAIASFNPKPSQATGELFQFVANQLTLSGDAHPQDNSSYEAGFMGLYTPTSQGSATGNIQIPSGYTNIVLHIEVYFNATILQTTLYSPFFHWEYTVNAAGSTVGDSVTFDQSYNPGYGKFLTYPVTAGTSVPLSIDVIGNSDPTQTGQFDKSRADVRMYLTGDLATCSPTAGTITTNITSGDPGSTVILMGNGWQTGTGNHYQIALDGVPVTSAVQAPASCTDQPNITFDIPCQTPPGLHQLACQLLDSANQPVLASVPQVPFTVTAPTIAPLATACPAGITIDFNESGIPLSSGKAPKGSPAFVNSVTMKAVLAFGTPSSGTYNWSTSSNNVSLSNTNSDTVTVMSVAESGSPNDVDIFVTYTVNSVSYVAHKTTTVQKPTFMGFVQVVDSYPNTCASGSAGWVKIIDWQVQDKWHNPIEFVLNTYDTFKNLPGSKNDTCGLKISGTAPGPKAITGPSGLWEHMYDHCTTVCANGGSCVTNTVQKYFVNGFEIDLKCKYMCNDIIVEGH